MLRIAEKEIPLELEGQVLPGFGGVEDAERPVFSLYAAENPVLYPLNKAAIAMRKGAHKLIAYFGYPDYDNVYEMYNLEEDPEEVRDLFQVDLSTFSRLKEELLDHLEDANRPYQSIN